MSDKQRNCTHNELEEPQQASTTPLSRCYTCDRPIDTSYAYKRQDGIVQCRSCINQTAQDLAARATERSK